MTTEPADLASILRALPVSPAPPRTRGPVSPKQRAAQNRLLARRPVETGTWVTGLRVQR